jgi:hypothetical protein
MLAYPKGPANHAGPYFCAAAPARVPFILVTPVEPSAAGEIVLPGTGTRGKQMRSVLLWFIGVPIPIILLLALCTHHF